MEPKKPALSSKSGSEKKSGPWRPTKRQVLWAICMVVALLTTTLLIIHLRPEIWKGLLEERNLTLIAIGVSVTAIISLLAIGGASLGWTGFGDKTVWDWLQLLSALAIPVVLAAAGLWFTAQQDARQQNVEDERAKAERKLAEQRAQDEALQAYLNQIGTLLLEKDLRKAQQDSEVRTLARARTLTVLERLDPSRKTAVMQFLNEAQLIQRVEGSEPIITLSGANLSGANLLHINLSGTKLRRADLSAANLNYANLRDADLSDANLHYADLSRAFLIEADLSSTYLSHANLFDADLF